MEIPALRQFAQTYFLGRTNEILNVIEAEMQAAMDYDLKTVEALTGMTENPVSTIPDLSINVLFRTKDRFYRPREKAEHPYIMVLILDTYPIVGSEKSVCFHHDIKVRTTPLGGSKVVVANANNDFLVDTDECGVFIANPMMPPSNLWLYTTRNLQIVATEHTTMLADRINKLSR